MGARRGWVGLILSAVLVTGCAGGVEGTAQAVGASGAVSSSALPGTLGVGPPATTAGPSVGTPAGATTAADPGASSAGQPTQPNQQPQQNLAWLQPGARLSYQLGAVSSAADRSSWNEDPNGPYVDPTTGKRYSSDRMAAPASQAAQGVRQFDVVSVDSSGVVAAVDDLVLNSLDNSWVSVPNPKVGPAQGKPGDLWIPPSTLSQFVGSGTGTGDQVLTGPYTFNNQQVNAIVLLNNNLKNYYFYAYDQASGILLRADTSVVYEGSPSPTAPNATNTRTSLELKAMRQRSFPGAGAALPSWAAQGATLNYAGQSSLMDSTTGQPMEGSTVALQQQVSITPGGSTWGNYQQNRQTQGAAGTETSTGYVTTTSTYVMDPQALGAMQAGTVLDTDPVTGEKWTVQQVGNGQVVLSRERSGSQWLGVYEISSGRLVQAQATTTTVVVQVQLQG